MADPSKEIVDRLYATPPDRFVAARDEAVRRARAAGDAAAARRLAALRRPTIAAWLANLLAIRRPDLIAELGDLAAALRTAQRELRGDALRELSARRRAAVSSLVNEARGLAVAADAAVDPGRLPLGEVENTLHAALSDAEVAAQLAAGRLLRAVTYTGFGEVPRPRLRLVPGGSGSATPTIATAGAGTSPETVGGGVTTTAVSAPDLPAGATGAGDVAGRGDGPAVDLVAVRRELTVARAARERAEAEVARVVRAQRDGADKLAAIEAELAELERRRSAADHELSRLKLARKAAERAAVAARRRAGAAQAAVESFGVDES